MPPAISPKVIADMTREHVLWPIYRSYGYSREQFDAMIAERERLNAIGPVHGPEYECDECSCPCHPPRGWE